MAEKGSIDYAPHEGEKLLDEAYANRLKTDSNFLGGELEKFRSMIFRACKAVVGDKYGNALADDLVQDTMKNAVRSIQTYNGTKEFSAWLHEIATNASLDQLRKFKSPKYADRNPMKHEDIFSDKMAGKLADPYQGLEQDMIDRERKGALDGFIDSLNPADKQIFSYRYKDNLGIVEIAELLGMNESTLRVRLSRLRDKLEKYLHKKITKEQK